MSIAAWMPDGVATGPFTFGRKPLPAAEPAPPHWRDRVHALFPQYVSAGFAPHHEAAWDWADAIAADSSPHPFVLVLARGGGKSTTAELIVTDLGVSDRRRYVLYVRETQEMADKSVGNVAAMLESKVIERYYPKHADKAVNKHGASRGWRRNRLVTGGGFVVDALGLDTASRGVKFDDQRPDLIVLDDIDGKHDSPPVTAKKIATITTSILPAGAPNAAVFAIQNLIIPDGVFSQLADGRAEFLATRTVVGPIPAVRNLTYRRVFQGAGRPLRAEVTGGQPTWQGQSLDVVQHQIDNWSIDAFLKEAQHEVDTPSHLQVMWDKCEIREFEIDPAWDGPYQGLDFGFSQDPLVLGQSYIDGGLLYVPYEAAEVGLDLHKTLEFCRPRIPNCDGYVTRADSARPESISYLRQHGMPKVIGVDKWPGSVKDGIEFLRTFDKIIIHPRCTTAAYEAKHYRYKVNKAGDPLSEPEDKNNNFWDQLRYALAPLIKQRRRAQRLGLPGTTSHSNV